MRRQTTETPYQPHRWVDELPDTAWANYAVWRDQAFRCEGNGQRLAYRLDAHVFDCDNRGARIAELRPADRMFEDLAAGIYRLATEDCVARLEAIVEIFGSKAKWDVWEIVSNAKDQASELEAQVAQITWSSIDPGSEQYIFPSSLRRAEV